ncbi:tail fiber protein [Phaeobacter sp. QD34_3]|uniref:phage tail protein n=1 Tax=unclassified Phaeobacter TaxID=2621772 RepID=UPI00237F571C|nr:MULTISPECIES: tail fiber protein [unclassified Phaeobacter]MDE4135068.1 tail fiber protein [Phaeobacter sp. QD34_3]MDE4138698.1 tail fiber protein [Phaeobacter sp. QD34_24]
MSEPFIAEIRIFAGTFAPRGWAFCNGQVLPIAQNTALFSLIGTIYGGDGRSTTALPNLQGRAPMHPGRGPGLTSRSLGQQGGVENVTLSEPQMPSHNHGVRAYSGNGGTNIPSDTTSLAGTGRDTLYQTDTATSLVDLAPVTIGTTGGNQSHFNMQPFLALNFIIALVGLYPSRS